MREHATRREMVEAHRGVDSRHKQQQIPETLLSP